MKTNPTSYIPALVLLLLCIRTEVAYAQARLANLRAYDQTGIHVFEAPRDTAADPGGLKVGVGGGFTLTFQHLKHQNTAAGLYKIAPGFHTPSTNLFLDVQLSEGIRLNLTSYLSSRQHNDTWIKGGYLQFDKLPFTGAIWSQIMQLTTLRLGYMEINYGDQHFRRSDGGHTLYNPFIENYILDAFTTEIAAEVLVRKNSWLGLAAISNGMIRGNVDSLLPTPQDPLTRKTPAFYFKAGWDKQLQPALRVRLTASVYTNKSSGGQTLYIGDRTGSYYLMVLERAGSTYAGNSLSGRLNPGFTKKVEAWQLNGLVKVHGLELFGTYEAAAGRSRNESAERKARQYAIDVIYRSGKTENLYLAARYNAVKARLADVPASASSPAIIYTDNMRINRLVFGTGWFLTKNILLKGEYVAQQYQDLPLRDLRHGGEFNGYVLQATIGF